MRRLGFALALAGLPGCVAGGLQDDRGDPSNEPTASVAEEAKLRCLPDACAFNCEFSATVGNRWPNKTAKYHVSLKSYVRDLWRATEPMRDASGQVVGGAALKDGLGTVRGANTDFEEVSSDPGTCRKLCCSNADCASGESCQAVDPSQGTLGVCVPPGAEWPGSGGAAGSGASGAPGVFSASCWSDPELECNPLDNSGCSSGDACDAIDDDPSYAIVVGCVGGEATKAAGESCDASFGPWCAPGYHCVRK